MIALVIKFTASTTVRTSPFMKPMIPFTVPLNPFTSGSRTFCLNQSHAPFQMLTMPSHTFPATSFTVSQFFTSSTIMAMRAVTATITSPMGEVRNATAAPNAVVTVVATAQIAFHAVVAAI